MRNHLFTIAAFAAGMAIAVPTSDNIPPLLCSSGNLFCCSQFVNLADITPAIGAVLELLDIDLDDIVSPFALGCSSENVLSAVGCQGTNACCSGTNVLFGAAVLDCTDGLL